MVRDDIFFLHGAQHIGIICASARGYGGMVDAEDLKSFGYCNRVGSSPTIPTKVCGCVAQLVRALRSHRRGRWFESNLIQTRRFPPEALAKGGGDSGT